MPTGTRIVSPFRRIQNLQNEKLQVLQANVANALDPIVALLGKKNLIDVLTGTHATTHVTGGDDVIADAVAAGNSGLMSGTDKTKLDGVETGATADQSNAEIKTAYEANADTNEFSDAEQTKLAGIETAADVTDSTNVNAVLVSPGPVGSSTPNTGKFTNVELSGVPPASPAANTIYKHPNAGGQAAITMDASDTDAALAPVLDAAQGAIAAGSLEDWHEVDSAAGSTGEPKFENSWVNYTSGFNTAAFRKTADGTVYIKGLVKSGSVSTTIFTLPAGYRPPAKMIWATLSSTGIGRMDIPSTGAILMASGGTGWFSIECSFFAGA